MSLPRGVRWATKDDVVSVLRTRWAAGTDLTELALGSAWEPLVIGLRPPSAAQYADDFDAVQAWANRWRARLPAGLHVQWQVVGGRRSGAVQLPVRAVIETREVLWRLLQVETQVSLFEKILAQVASDLPDARTWVARHPQRVLAVAPHWSSFIAVVRWVRDAMPTGAWIRQVDVPGVDTKFVEAHRETLAALLEVCLPPERIFTGSSFAQRYGFAVKPAYARLRRPDGTHLLPGVSEMAVPVSELNALDLPGQVFVVENETTYHAFPPVPDTLLFLGSGYGVSRLLQVDWLAHRPVTYWGDLDTHGFVMLDRLRARFPQVRSMLMDRTTLLEHERHWGVEDSPVNAHLEHLSADEAALYVDLVEDRYAVGLRLEQERIRFGRVLAAVGL
nr:Wadjet anti-phage system protein JetD domain-containing protein [Kineosporia rhizophila]